MHASSLRWDCPLTVCCSVPGIKVTEMKSECGGAIMTTIHGGTVTEAKREVVGAGSVSDVEGGLCGEKKRKT